MKLLKLLRSFGKVLKIKHQGHGRLYSITHRTNKKTVHIQVSIFKG